MRLWSIHPELLDAKGLVALWREALLAQAVLAEQTRGYRNHPQLARFRATRNPRGAIATYLRAIAAEADRRGYHFDRSKIARRSFRGKLPVTLGQINYELAHLLGKLRRRDPARYEQLRETLVNPDHLPQTHPLCSSHPGPIEPWERAEVVPAYPPQRESSA